MNPSLGETAGINLPPPVTEQNSAAGLNSQGGAAFSRGPESRPAAAESAPRTAGAQTAALPALPQMSVPAAAQSAVPAARPGAQPAAVPIKDDNDSIEKEWVNKAKQIVERTRDDPYRQSEELTVVKADYMKQRYNKTVKTEK